jgi:hypothetical protein
VGAPPARKALTAFARGALASLAGGRLRRAGRLASLGRGWFFHENPATRNQNLEV